jgi:hypothetical protein
LNLSNYGPDEVDEGCGSAEVVANAAHHLLAAMNFKDAVVISADLGKHRFACDEVFKARDALRDALAATSHPTPKEPK